MNAFTRTSLKARRSTGSSIAEFAPALFIILIIFLFPGIDLLALGLGWCAGSMLNTTQLREAALEKASDARKTDATGVIKQKIVNTWCATGLGLMTKATADKITTKVNYYQGAVGTDIVAEVVTTVPVSPFLQIPFIPGVPGMSAPVTFTYTTEQLLENAQNFDVAGGALPNKE